MKNIRNIALCAIVISAIATHNHSLAKHDAMGVKGLEKLDEVIEKNMPALKDTSAAFGNQFGAQFGTGALTMIGAAATKTGAAIAAAATKAAVTAKAAIIVIASAPAAPYVAGGVVATGGVYSIYRFFNPTVEELEYQKKRDILISERDLTTCLRKNLETISQCNNFASAYAIVAGADAADKIIYAAQRYSRKYNYAPVTC